MRQKNKKKYIIAIDGGGTKTTAALADLEGNIIFKKTVAGSNIDKIGFEEAMNNILRVINIILKQEKNISFIYLALAGGTQRDEKRRKDVEKHLAQKLNFQPKKFLVEGDEIAAFRSGTDEKNGIVIIAGTGSIVVGWNNNKKKIVGGWGHLWSDEGSAFWIGKKALQATSNSIDNCLSSTFEKEILKKLKIRKSGDLMGTIYNSSVIEKISSLALTVDEMDQRQKNKEARNILVQAGESLALQANKIIKELNFRQTFLVVLAGSVFNSMTVLNTTKKEITRTYPKAIFIRPKSKPIIGAVKLAIENYKNSILASQV